jgi:hypothetical protein
LGIFPPHFAARVRENLHIGETSTFEAVIIRCSDADTDWKREVPGQVRDFLLVAPVFSVVK